MLLPVHAQRWVKLGNHASTSPYPALGGGWLSCFQQSIPSTGWELVATTGPVMGGEAWLNAAERYHFQVWPRGWLPSVGDR